MDGVLPTSTCDDVEFDCECAISSNYIPDNGTPYQDIYNAINSRNLIAVYSGLSTVDQMTAYSSWRSPYPCNEPAPPLTTNDIENILKTVYHWNYGDVYSLNRYCAGKVGIVNIGTGGRSITGPTDTCQNGGKLPAYSDGHSVGCNYAYNVWNYEFRGNRTYDTQVWMPCSNPECPENYTLTNGMCCPDGYEYNIELRQCIQPCPNQHPFPSKDQVNYSYSDEWVAGEGDASAINDAYCIRGGGIIETSIELIDDKCVEKHRCKRKDDCTKRDEPFPTIDDSDCIYTEAWKDDDADASEKRFDCIMNNEWKPTGWTRLTDGTCHDTYDYTTGDIKHARIDCEDWSACKKCTYHTWANNSNPNIPACWTWTPGDSTSGHEIYVQEPIPVDPYEPGPNYPYDPPDFPPYPDFPPFHDYPIYEPEPPIGPIQWNPWPPYDPNPDNPDDYQWCDCDIKDTVSNNCGCFEKPVKNSGLSCSGYFPKTYKKWAAYFCYNNSEDTL